MSWLAQLALSVRHSDPVEIVAFIALLAGGAGGSGWLGFRDLGNARTVEDIPSSKIRSAAQGYVELQGVGRMMDGPPIASPISGRACVWYHYRVEERVRDNRGWSWRTIEKNTSADIFWLEDDTGRVIVDPDGAQVTVRRKDVWYSTSSARGQSGWPVFINQYLTGANPMGVYRFIEERLEPGERLFAIGLLKNMRNDADGPGLHDAVGALLHQWKQDQQTLLARFDLDGDGKLNEMEWHLAELAARREVQHTQAQEQANAGSFDILGRTADARRPYLLSALPRRDLARRYRRFALFYGLGFFALGAVAVWLFNARFIS